MNNIQIKRQHNLGREQARERVDEIAETLRNELMAECTWKDDSLCFERIGATGTIDVSNDHVELNIQLEMLLIPLKGTIENAILKRIDEVFGDISTQ